MHLFGKAHFAYIAFGITVFLVLNGVIAAIWIFGISMVALPGLYGEALHKMRLVPTEGYGTFLSFIVGCLIASTMAFIK